MRRSFLPARAMATYSIKLMNDHRKNLSYKQKLFFYFVIIFAVFTIGILLFEQSREHEFKTGALTEKLDVYAGMVNTVFMRSGNYSAIDSLSGVFPPDIRLTLINSMGRVLYDNVLTDTLELENHAGRPEIRYARRNGTGVFIRTSSSTNQAYLYYAKRFNNYYVRVALPYNIQVKDFLRPGNGFIYFILCLFVLMLFVINYVAGRFGRSIRQLRDFALAVEKGENIPVIHFPHDELGEIGARITDDYQSMKESRRNIALEREKLLQHVHSSGEGICFFTSGRGVEFYNSLFIQYLNTIIDGENINPSGLLNHPAFEKVKAFLDMPAAGQQYFETTMNCQGKHFIVRVNRFDDSGFEVTINDVTQLEKTRLLKQEMTGNIAHELRTPVTGIRGYLETVLEQPLDADKQWYFIKKAYGQTLVLSELIRDMGLITKMEGAPQLFTVEPVSIAELIDDVCAGLEPALQEKQITVNNKITGDVVVRGNRQLLYSIFRNLTENVIGYAGAGVSVIINRYSEDKEFYYFSYADTGVGIPGEHLPRLFERFYRVSEGRSRDTGGSGLGLSIVKNAVLFHKGAITAKNRAGGGLELLFTLPK